MGGSAVCVDVKRSVPYIASDFKGVALCRSSEPRPEAMHTELSAQRSALTAINAGLP